MMGQKNFLFGLSTGIIIISILFYAGFLILKPTKIIEGKTITTEMTDEQIIEKARKMGMIFIKELPNKTEEKNTELSDEEIIKRAIQLGYIKEETNKTDQEENKETENTEKQEETEKNEISVEEPESLEAPVTIVIKSGSATMEISEILYEKGIIDSAEGFTKYVRENNKTKLLVAGEYTLYKDMDYDSVLRIITWRKG